MRKLFSIFAALLVLGFSGTAFAQFLVVTYDQVVVNPEGIFVEVHGDLVGVNSLTPANDGYLVATIKVAICPICGSSKYEEGKLCPVCDFPNNGDDFRAKKSTCSRFD